MDKRAIRRIKGGSPAKDPVTGRDASGWRRRPLFWQFLLASFMVHAAALAVVYLSSSVKPQKTVELVSVSVVPLPGPAGGGGKSEEIKTPKEQPKKKEVPEKEAVKVPSKLAEKPKEPPKKKQPEKIEAPKPQPELPAGPGQGPVGGGSKSVPNALTGPVTIQGGDSRFAEYLGIVQGKITRAWSPPSVTGRKAPVAVLSFTILRDGSVTDIAVQTPSGLSYFDRSAESALRSLKKVPRLPAAFDGNSMVISCIFMPEKNK